MSKRFPKIGWIIMTAALVVALGILPACGGGGGGGGGVNPTIPYKNDGIFVQSTIGDIDSLDPAWAYDTASGEQIQYMYDGLVFLNYTSTDVFKPLLAKNWSMAVNGSQMRFYVEPGHAQFANGENVTAEDAAYSIQRVMIQDRAGGPDWMFWVPLIGHSSTSGGVPRADWVDNVTTAVQVDGDYVVFNFLPAPWPETVWLQIMSQTWAAIVDKSWCLAHGEWDGTANNGTGNSSAWTYYNKPAKSQSYLYNHAMGAGPWKFNNWNPGTSITLDRFDGYWQGAAAFTQVVTNVVDEWSSRKLALQNGDVDFTYVPQNYLSEVINWTDLNKYSNLPNLQIDSIFFNFNISATSPYIGTGSLSGGTGIPTDFFADRNIRRGFCYAFDYNTYLTDILQGEATQMANPIVEGLFGYDAGAPKYSYCLTEAKSLLQNTATHGNLSTTGFTLTLAYNTGNDARKTACELLQAALLTIDSNFHINIQSVSWPTFLDLIFADIPMDLPMFQVGWRVDYPDPDNFVAPYMEPESYGYAWSQMYGNSTISGLIASARYMPNNATRLAIYHQLEEIYYYDAPSVILFQTLGRRFFTKYVHGFYFNPVFPGNAGPLYYMYKAP